MLYIYIHSLESIRHCTLSVQCSRQPDAKEPTLEHIVFIVYMRDHLCLQRTVTVLTKLVMMRTCVAVVSLALILH